MNWVPFAVKPRFAALIALTIVSLPFASVVVGAQSEGIVAQRQQAMKHMAAAAKTIAGMFGGTQDYDVEAFRAAAAILLHDSGQRLSGLFDGKATEKSSAEAEKIASERQAFDGIAARLEELATAFDEKALQAGEVISPDMRMSANTPMIGGLLASRKPRNEPALAELPAEHLFHMMLETCTECHGSYRVRK